MSGSAADFLTLGDVARLRGDWSEARRHYESAVALGDPFTAHFWLGRAYSDGEGGPQDHARAADHFRKSGDAGLPQAYAYLGLAYLEGEGVPKNEAEAIRLLEIAAQAGDNGARLQLGFSYTEGQGVPQDYAKAAQYWRQAAKHGPPEIWPIASKGLGALYEHGKGVRQNYLKAWWLYRRALRGGDVGALDDIDRAFSKLERVLFFYLPLVVLPPGVVTLIIFWNALTVVQQFSAALVLAGFFLWFCYGSIWRTGKSARIRIAEQFKKALDDKISPVRIGGTNWTIYNGEFQKLVYNNPARGPMRDGTSTWQNRLNAEVAFLRLWDPYLKYGPMAASGLGATGLAGLAPSSCNLIAGIVVLSLVPFYIREYLYAHGYQGLHAAMVLDPRPAFPELEAVEQQKAHGDSRIESLSGTQTAATGRGSTRRSRVEDQEF